MCRIRVGEEIKSAKTMTCQDSSDLQRKRGAGLLEEGLALVHVSEGKVRGAAVEALVVVYTSTSGIDLARIDSQRRE